MARVLITGGAGFIGSHVADELLRAGDEVRVLDRLVSQVHGEGRDRPDYLHRDVELIVGDIGDPAALRYALDGIDLVVHLAASVGVGQSMYEPLAYARTNTAGTAALWEALAVHRVERVVVASSMSIYGEGLYEDVRGERVAGAHRRLEQLRRHEWDLRDAHGDLLRPLPTPEEKIPSLASMYALTKYDQERMSLLFGEAYDIPTVALRFFNVYGPRQALSNPYTGVLAIFASRLLNGNSPLVFEDGHQRRDFVHVADVARAVRMLLHGRAGTTGVLNVGSGRSRSVLEITESLGRAMNLAIEPRVTGDYRVGDIRHCFADITRLRELGFEPRVDLESGLAELAEWVAGCVAEDHVDRARSELASRGLTL